MLDPNARLTIPRAPDVVVYGDHADPARFYAWAASPRIKAESGGALQLSLLLYRRGKHGPTEGGQISLATTLAISDEEREAVASTLAESGNPLMSQQAGGASGSGPEASARISIVSPEWLSGSVRVHIVDGLDLAGRPSLNGANDCSLGASLTAAQAQSVEAALDAGLKDSVATYDVEVAVARVDVAASDRSAEAPGKSESFHYEVAVTSADRLPIEVSGPLRVSAAQLESMKTSFAL
jgi:hypothetical protein